VPGPDDGRRPIDAVVFDMDGVLIDSEPLWREAEVSVFGELGIALTPEMLDQTVGRRLAEVVEHWYARHPWPGPTRGEVAARLLDAVVHAVHARGGPAPGAIEAVAFFERRGMRLALATSSPPPLIEAALDAVGLAGRFEAICSAEDEVAGKPDPAVFLRAAAVLGVPPSRCLAVEDSPNGVRAAKAAGMRCLAVPAAGADDAVRGAGADAVIASLVELDDEVLARAGVRAPAERRSFLPPGAMP
jgi:sugar-phosphatase